MTDVLYDSLTQSIYHEVKVEALRQIGDLQFDLYSEVPIVWLPAQIVVDPNEIGEFVWPGNVNASFTHTEYITPAQQASHLRHGRFNPRLSKGDSSHR